MTAENITCPNCDWRNYDLSIEVGKQSDSMICPRCQKSFWWNKRTVFCCKADEQPIQELERR